MSAALFGETEARYAALSGLVHGARVLDLSSHADHRAIDALVTAGATSLTVSAPESVRRDLTTHHVDLQLVTPLELPLQLAPRSFDVVVCFDLIERIAQDPGWMDSLRDVLTPEGAIVVATTSAEEASRVLGPSFGVATVFAQSPLVGHMLYDVAAHELETELDRTWAEGADDEPSSYVVVFAPDERHNDKLTLVQMPFAAWERAANAERERLRQEPLELRHELANVRSELEVAVDELTSLRREVDQLRASAPVAGDPGDELVRQRNDRNALEEQLADMLQESATMTERLLAWQTQRESIELELVTERARVVELTTELGLTQQSSSDYEAAMFDREVRLSASAARVTELEAEVAERDARVVDLELAVTELEKSLRERPAEPVDYEAAQQNAAVAELQDTLALERSAAYQAKLAADSEREVAKRRIDELQRALDLSRRRGDDLARSLDNDRQQLAELKDGLENERQRAEALKKELSASLSKENDSATGQKASDGES